MAFPAVAVGIAVGLALSSFATVLLTGDLFGISVTDFATYSLSAALVAATALSVPFIASRTEQEGAFPRAADNDLPR